MSLAAETNNALRSRAVQGDEEALAELVKRGLADDRHLRAQAERQAKKVNYYDDRRAQ